MSRWSLGAAALAFIGDHTGAVVRMAMAMAGVVLWWACRAIGMAIMAAMGMAIMAAIAMVEAIATVAVAAAITMALTAAITTTTITDTTKPASARAPRP